MSTSDGQDGHPIFMTGFDGADRHGSLETMLFESLVHHLIEKGVLTQNDALSVLQTVASVKRGQSPDEAGAARLDAELALLRRLYESFGALDARVASNGFDGTNVRQLRPPLHGDAPEFPRED